MQRPVDVTTWEWVTLTRGFLRSPTAGREWEGLEWRLRDQQEACEVKRGLFLSLSSGGANHCLGEGSVEGEARVQEGGNK